MMWNKKMNKWLYVGALLFGLTACSSDDVVGGSDTPNAGNATLTFNAGNQARILTPNQAAGAKAQTRATADPAAPSIPSDAIEFDKESMNNWNDGVLLSKGKNYKVTKSYKGSVSANDWNSTEEINIYISADVEFTTWWSDYQGLNANVYVLPGGSLKWDQAGWDQMVKIPGGTKVYVWGDFTMPDNCGLRLIDGNNNGGELYVFNGENPLWVKTANGNKANVCFQVDSKAKFYSSREVVIDGTASFLGQSHFANTTVINYNMFPGYGSHTIFDKCSRVIGQLDDRNVTNPATIDINEYLYVGSLHNDGRPLTINMTEALLDIDNNFTTVNNEANYMLNRFVDKGDNSLKIVGKDGSYYSVVRMLKGDENTLYFDRGNEYDVVAGDGTPTKFEVQSITGYVTILSSSTKIQYPKIQGKDDITDIITFADSKVHYNDGDVYLPATDCRPAIGDGAIIVSPDVQHKYSATSLDFSPNGTLYLCWHSNANTNKEDGEEYGGSVSGTSDWGGIVDVIDVKAYDPSSSLFLQTMIQNEHKYNHIKYYSGKLYLAGTSNKVGAALHELKLNGNTIDESDAGIRVNLTGTSGNCVDILNGKLLTISGFNNGGINYFALNDYSNQEKKFINEASSEYQGKYIYVDSKANKVVSLNNTTRGIVTIYNPSTMAVEKSFEVGAIQPKDGKNVCISDGSKIYICRGQNGFEVYDFNGNKVGGSNKHANGCDVDDKYIYIATGDGFAILDKNAKDAAGNNLTLKVVKFTGTGFVYPGTRGGKQDDSVKSSSNFVKVYNGKVYVAHGMYGLRIYKLSDLVD